MRTGAAIIVWTSLALAISPAPAMGADTEALVKGAYLFKLASFVRWPGAERRADSFRICVLGRQDVAQALSRLTRDQRISGLPVDVISLRAATRTIRCDILFLGSGPERAHVMADATQDKPVLTVGDVQNGTGFGVIDFTMRDGKVRLAIDTRRATERGLELSSKLLGVAVEVER